VAAVKELGDIETAVESGRTPLRSRRFPRSGHDDPAETIRGAATRQSGHFNARSIRAPVAGSQGPVLPTANLKRYCDVELEFGLANSPEIVPFAELPRNWYETPITQLVAVTLLGVARAF